jgi:MoxR-like ATPase
MPADITGTQAFRAEQGVMEFLPGPIFHSLVLVDEINRAPPKVQSALLEAMGEHQVTVGGVTRELPEPFMVVATQNPLEQEGTFPLPEAQLDRFMMHVLLDLPGEAQELAILDMVEGEIAGRTEPDAPVLTHDNLAAMKGDVAQVHVSVALRQYIVRLVMATRAEADGVEVLDRIRHGVSPRGTLALAACARARAFLHGRDYAIPEDVAALAPDTLCHRLVPTWRALAQGETSRTLFAEILAAVRPL